MNRWLPIILMLGCGLAQAAEKSGGIADMDMQPPPPATVGTGTQAQPAAPAKGVEEPVFQLPDLVIVGENQARIMAQKEALTGSPLQGLHEAPLLEKEESSVAALRRREPAPTPYPTRTGSGALIRMEGGTGGAMLGGGWIGRQTDRSLLGLDFHVARAKGEPVGTGNAGGWDAGATLHAGWDPLPNVFDPLGIRKAVEKVFGTAEHSRASIGFGIADRELPGYTATPDASRRRISLKAMALNSASGWMSESGLVVRYASVETPGLETDALGFALDGEWSWARRGPFTVILRPRLEAETADGSGGPSLLGGSLEAAWVPNERIRALAGFALDGASSARPAGGRSFSGLAAPVVGVAWTAPFGPTFVARFAPRLSVPWVARQAVESPYSVFGNPTVPERVLGDVRASVRQGHRDGSIVELSYRLRESRRMNSWAERPGEGLFTPVPVSSANIHEGGLSLKITRWRPAVVTVEGRWRDIRTSGGAIANLPESEGSIGVEVPWKAFVFGASVDVARSRPGSITGAMLPGFGDLGLQAEWAPRPRWSILLAGSNLGAARVERWAGYPEPRRLVTLGLRATF